MHPSLHPSVYLRPNVIAEPLFNQWYAWSYLISPATAAMYMANSHIPIMESFVAAPQVHAATLKNPAMQGGPFIDYPPDRTPEIQALCQQTQTQHRSLLALAQAIQDLEMILAVADGTSLEPLYDQVPEALKGYVELVYDQNQKASMRLMEGLLYCSAYYDQTRQSIALSLGNVDARSFVLSTPRLPDRQRLSLNLPFNHPGFDRLFQMRQQPYAYTQIREELGISPRDEPLFSEFFTEIAPTPIAAYQGDAVRVRYLGHACVLIETDRLCILCDPLVAYPNQTGIPRYSYADLPDRIDYALITHNHQDHVMLETLLQLRHKIRTVIVPKSNSGVLIDPSLKLALQAIGFNNVREIDQLETLNLPDGSLTGLPFLGEHGDLNIAAKTAYLIQLKGRSLLCAADSNNIEPKLYEHLYDLFGAIDVLFIGMECEGAPYTWAYGALLTQPVPRQHAQTRRLDGSNADRAIALVNQLQPQQAYVYAMGQEPWLTFITSITYTHDSKPIVESDRFIAHCQQAGIRSQRLFGQAELFLEPRSPLAPLKKGGTRVKVPLFKEDLGGSLAQATVMNPTLAEFLAELQQWDIKLWLDCGETGQKPEPSLRCNAPKGVLTPALQARLKQYKPAIIEFLSQDGSTQLQQQLQAEVSLDPAIVPSAELQPPNPQPQQILLTGATGFVGAFLLDQLLQQTTAQIICLVRADTLDQAWEKIQQNLAAYDLEGDRDRITPLLGDLAQPKLGLTDSQFQTLAAQVDTIYHNGAWVNHTLPYTALKAANVLGTEEILRLATQVKLKPVHFISTISVFGADASPTAPSPISERAILADYPLPVMGYAQSKRIAEQRVQIGRDRGIPITIYRLGAVSGSSQTGVFNRNDFLYRLLLGCVQLGSVPDRAMILDLLPVDYVSRAIVTLSQQPTAIEQAFHLVHPQPVASQIIFEFLLSRGYAVDCLNYAAWRDRLMAIAQADSTHPLYPLVTLLPSANSPATDPTQITCRYSTDIVQQSLQQADIHCPAIDHALLSVYLNYLIQSGSLAPPPLQSAQVSPPVHAS
jgi:thioester reductase-like protein